MERRKGMYSHSVTLWRLLLIAAVASSVAPSMCRAQTLVIAKYQWTNGVRNLQPVNRLGSVVQPQPICLWIQIEADEATLDELESRGMLPIRCRWIRLYGTQEEFSERDLIDEITLGIGKKEVVTKLRYEVTDPKKRCVGGKPCFDWRTWSRKVHAYSGDWIVEVVYSDPQRTPVLYRKDGQLRPFRCGIRVK
jgi:hypothetical protein